MNHHSELSEVFRPHLQWHRARLDFLAAFVLALIRVRSVHLAWIAVALNPWVHIASNYRRCQRFLAGFSFDQETIGRLILQLLPQNPEQKLVLSLDRTEWKLGRLSINLLFIGVAHQGVAYPLVWCFLGKVGSSNLRERLGLLRRLLTLLPKARMQSLCADREFACTGPALAESALHPAHQSGEPGHLQGPKPTRPAVVPASGVRGVGSPAQTGSAVGATHLPDGQPFAEGGVPASDYGGRSPASPCSIRPALGDRNPLQSLQNPGLRLRIHPPDPG